MRLPPVVRRDPIAFNKARAVRGHNAAYGALGEELSDEIKYEEEKGIVEEERWGAHPFGEHLKGGEGRRSRATTVECACKGRRSSIQFELRPE